MKAHWGARCSTMYIVLTQCSVYVKPKQLDQDREATRLSPQLEQIIFRSFKLICNTENIITILQVIYFQNIWKKFYLSVMSGRIRIIILWEKPLFHVVLAGKKIIQIWMLSYKKQYFDIWIIFCMLTRQKKWLI